MLISIFTQMTGNQEPSITVPSLNVPQICVAEPGTAGSGSCKDLEPTTHIKIQHLQIPDASSNSQNNSRLVKLIYYIECLMYIQTIEKYNFSFALSANATVNF